MEGERRSEMEFTDIATMAESIDSSVIFHLVTDILGFVLFMHQQIPSMLQDISQEFEALDTEYKELVMVLAEAEVKASLRRQHLGRKREVRHGIRRLEKLMHAVSSFKTSLQLIISEVPSIERVILLIGASPIRPQHVYDLSFSQGSVVSGAASDFSRSRMADGISKKAIRALISKGAGSESYPGPTKLFLLILAPSSFNLPLHFLPKRDFRFSKKIVPFRLHFKCKCQDREPDARSCHAITASSISLRDSASNDLIWFQCRHVIKGLPAKGLPEEE